MCNWIMWSDSTYTNEFLCHLRCTEVAVMTLTSVMMMSRESPQSEALKGKNEIPCNYMSLIIYLAIKLMPIYSE